jgi:hypothetical protein
VQVDEHHPGEHQIEAGADGQRRRAGFALDVGVDEVALPMPGSVQPVDRVAAEPGVDVHAQYHPRRPDPLGHQPHRLARPAAHIQTDAAGPQRRAVEQCGGVRLPYVCLPAQPLVLPRRAVEHVLSRGHGIHRDQGPTGLAAPGMHTRCRWTH